MARITKDETLELTRDEAARFITNLDGRVAFQLKVTSFMPTGDDKGFEGVTFITVSRRVFKESVLGMLSEILEGRGAKIRLNLHAAETEGGRAYVSTY